MLRDADPAVMASLVASGAELAIIGREQVGGWGMAGRVSQHAFSCSVWLSMKGGASVQCPVCHSLPPDCSLTCIFAGL